MTAAVTEKAPDLSGNSVEGKYIPNGDSTMSDQSIAPTPDTLEMPAWATERTVDDDVHTWGAVVVTDSRDLEHGSFHGLITRMAFLDHNDHPVEVAARWGAPTESEEFYIDVKMIPGLIAYLEKALQIVEAAK